MTATRRLTIPSLLTLAALAGIVMLPSFLFGPGATHSHLYNYIWTSQFGTAMAAGDLYPRWLPRSFEGLGSPTFYFYPPIAYWLAGGFDALGLSTFQAINMAGLTLMLASGVAMYLWLAERGTAPLIGAALYMAAPYHLIDFFVRGALAEYAAFIWLPLIALGIERLPRRRGAILLTVAWGAMIATHLPVAMLTALFLIMPLMGHRLWRDRAVLLPGACAGLAGTMLAAFYWLPALTLQDHISASLLWDHGYLATAWSIWTSSFELFPCLVLGLILLAWPDRSIWTAIAVAAAMAAVRLIPFLWDIALLDKAQFPWRVLCIAEFATVTALVSARPRWPTWAMGGTLLLFPMLVCGITTAGNLSKTVDYARIMRVMPDAPEYLPAGFDLSRVTHPDRWTDLSAARGLPAGDMIRVRRAGPVTLRHAAFPIWRVTRDGRPVPSAGPLIRFDASPGVYRIERVAIWQERLGLWLSVAAALALLLASALPIRLLSKFPPYSPFSAISGWAGPPWLGRHRNRGGA
ncbi:MAG: integral membrane-like protein [Sphingobium sp.]|nr:integral membrane-like protein [Sphingobium sp.]